MNVNNIFPVRPREIICTIIIDIYSPYIDEILPKLTNLRFGHSDSLIALQSSTFSTNL